MLRWFLGFLRFVAFASAVAGATLPFLSALGAGNPQLLAWYFAVFAVGILALVTHSYFQQHQVIDRTYDFVRELFRAPYVWVVGFWVGGMFATLFMGAGWLLHYLQEPANWSSISQSGVVGSLLKPPHGIPTADFPWREQAGGAFGALLTGVSMVVVVGAFYRRLAPYTDLWDLIEEIERDVQEQQRMGGRKLRVWWAYPGFGLGRYRSLNPDGSPGLDDGRYMRFRSTLTRLLASKDVDVEAIVYDEQCLDVFYGAYFLQQARKNGNPMVGASTADSIQMSKDIASALNNVQVMACSKEEKELFGSARSFNEKVYSTRSPGAIPTFVIVVGDVVYQIANYGSPIYMDVNPASGLAPPCRDIGGVFFPSDGHSDHLLKLVAFRRHDRAYADTVAKHLSQHAAAALAMGLVSH